MIQRFILFFARIPFVLWVLIGGAWCYQIYNEWKDKQYAPLEQQEITLQQQTGRLRAQNAEAEKFDKERDAKLRLISELGEKFNQSSKKIPRSPNIPVLLKSLADISDRTGLVFSSFRPQGPVQDEFLTLTPLEVNLKGTYAQIMSFIDSTAQIERVLVTREMHMSNARKRGQGTTLDAKAILYTYYIQGGSNEGGGN